MVNFSRSYGDHREVTTLKSNYKTEGTTVWEFGKSRREKQDGPTVSDLCP